MLDRRVPEPSSDADRRKSTTLSGRRWAGWNSRARPGDSEFDQFEQHFGIRVDTEQSIVMRPKCGIGASLTTRGSDHPQWRQRFLRTERCPRIDPSVGTIAAVGSLWPVVGERSRDRNTGGTCSAPSVTTVRPLARSLWSWHTTAPVLRTSEWARNPAPMSHVGAEWCRGPGAGLAVSRS
jgi:hypothetical protein